MKTSLFTLTLVLMALISIAQAPQGISYQAVVRNAENELIADAIIGVRISLIRGTPDGTVVFEETHMPLSNENGLVSFVIGNGNLINGAFTDINWADGPYFVRTEIDPEGNTNYIIDGTAQLMSVPYALFAQNAAGSMQSGTLPGELLYWNGTEWISVAPGTHGQFLSFCNGVPSWERCPAILVTHPVTSNFGTAAIARGTVVADGGTYISHYGLCWSTNPNPSTADNTVLCGYGLGDFIGVLSGLNPLTTYYVRAYAVNQIGTYYGNEVSFVAGTSVCGVDMVSDMDGNSYNTVLINDQCWMKENLKTSKYNNGAAIAYPGGSMMWQFTTVGGYAWYNNDVSWKESYGALYNWFAVNNSNGLCPAGWRVPANVDWVRLFNFVDAYTSTAGNKLKSCRQVNSPLGGECSTSVHPRWEFHEVQHGTDDHAYSALPGGLRNANGSYQALGESSNWWSINESNTETAWYRRIIHSHSDAMSGYSNKNTGLSVRCLMDAK